MTWRSFLRAYANMLPALLFLGIVLPRMDRLIQALILAGVSTVFLYAGVVKSMGIMPRKSVFWFGMDRLYAFFTPTFLFLSIYAGFAVVSFLVAAMAGDALSLRVTVLFILILTVISYPALTRLWPVLAIAFVVPDELGHRRVALGLMGHFWIGPGLKSVFGWTRSYTGMWSLHLLPVGLIHVLLLSIIFYPSLTLDQPWHLVIPFVLLFGLLPVMVFVTTAKCRELWERMDH